MKSQLCLALLIGLCLYAPRGGDLFVQEAAAEERAEKIGRSLSVLAWNVFLRPRKLFNNGQSDRAALIPKHVTSFEVLVLSEAFDDDLRSKIISSLAGTHPYVSKVVGKDRGYKQDGGVVVLSRWPIQEQGVVLFGDRCQGPDCLADKGALYVQILKEGVPFHLFATHLQARGEGAAVRRSQLAILRQFVESKAIPPSEPVIFAGDLNVDRHSDEFAQMLEVLDASCPPFVGHAFTTDPKNDLVPSSRLPVFVDYVLYSNSHLRPKEAELKTRIFRDHVGDLSDHYAVLGSLLFTPGRK